MKFIHLSDICIGSSAESGTVWEAQRRSELLQSLRTVLDHAKENGTDLLLISGGLFSHIPSEQELQDAADIFAAYPQIRVVITAGPSDPVSASSAVHSFAWPDQVHYVCTGAYERIVFPELKTEIFASSVLLENPEVPAFAGSDITELTDRKPICIAMLSCDDPAELNQRLSVILDNGGLSYAAVGSRVLKRELAADRIYCAGSMEPVGAADTGEHGILEGEISETSGSLKEIRFVPLASAAYVTLGIRIRPETGSGELLRSIEREMERRGTSNIYRLRLTGLRNPEMMPDFSRLHERFRIREIVDETQPEYDFGGLFREHPQDMIGFYISSITNRRGEMSPIEKKAMYYGINALLKTAEDEESV